MATSHPHKLFLFSSLLRDDIVTSDLQTATALLTATIYFGNYPPPVYDDVAARAPSTEPHVRFGPSAKKCENRTRERATQSQGRRKKKAQSALESASNARSRQDVRHQFLASASRTFPVQEKDIFGVGGVFTVQKLLPDDNRVFFFLFFSRQIIPHQCRGFDCLS